MKVNTHTKPLYIIIDDALFQKLEKEVAHWNSNLLMGCKKLNLDFMVYLIDLITRKGVEKKSSLINGFVRLKAEYFKDVFHNYKYQVDFLEIRGFLSKIPYSIEKGESYGYKINYPIESLKKKKFRVYDFNRFTFRKKISALHFSKMEKADRTTKHVTKWLRDTVEFDYDMAINYLHSQPMKDSKLYHRLYCCEVLKRCNVLYSRNGKDDRLHSTLTNIPSELRQFLRFKDSENDLISLDIKSSQPFHLAGLVNLMVNEQADKIHFLSTLIKKTRLRNKFNSCMSIMIPKTLEEPDRTELKGFVKTVTEQDLYEYIGSKFSAEHLQNIRKGSLIKELFYNPSIGKKQVKSFTCLRDYCKLAVLEYMYCSIKSKENRYLEIRRILPPAINELIDALKEVNPKLKDTKSDFPIILQNIEAGLFLDVLCFEFSHQNPLTPFITIHDSIMVEESMKQVVHDAFTNGYQQFLGIKPTLD